jgi:hypothetical protein
MSATVTLPTDRREGGMDRRHKGEGEDPFIGALEGQKGHCMLGCMGVLRHHGRAWRARVERAVGSARHSGNGLREGHARGNGFVHTSMLGAELDREGIGCGHAARMGTPAHSAYTARG